MTAGGRVISILGLALLVSVVQGQCDNSCVHCCSGNKVDYDYPNPPDSDSTAFMLYELLEQSLLNDSLNLYKMRRVFFPNIRPKPIVVTVSYYIIFHTITDQPCAGALNGIKLVEDKSTSVAIFPAKIIWTSSIAFSALHPEVIDWLTPTFLYWLGSIHGSYFNHSSSDVNIHLTLNIPFLPCTPSLPQMMDALSDITTMLKAFAEAKGPVSSANPKYKGFYVFNESEAKHLAYLVFYIPTAALMITTFFIYSKFGIIKWMTNLMRTYANPFSMFAFIIYYTVVEIVGVWWWLGENRAVATILSKFVIFLFTFYILTPVCTIGSGKAPVSFKSWSSLAMLTTVSWHVTPIVILTLVNPVETLATMLAVIASGGLIGSSILFYSSNSKYGNAFITLGFAIAGWVLLTLVRLLLHFGADTDGIHGAVFAFAPGIVITIANWVFRKNFVHYKKDSEKDVEHKDHSEEVVKNEDHSDDTGTEV